jgi:hypothetical protein
MAGEVFSGEHDPRSQAHIGLFAAAEHAGASFGMI